MEEISYKVTIPDPYQTAYDTVIMEFNNRLRKREMDGIEAALKEHGYVKERTCKVESWHLNSVEVRNGTYKFSCGHDTIEPFPNYCPNCGAKVVGD